MIEFYTFDTENRKDGSLVWCSYFNGKEVITFDDQESSIQFLTEIKKKSNFFAVNLEYDLVNLFGTEKLLKETTLIYGKSRLIVAEFNKFIKFYDTLNHFQISVYNMAKQLGMKKPDIDFTTDKQIESEEGRIRCEEDTKITWFYIEKMLKNYDRIGVKFKATIASSALNFFLTNYNSIRLRKIKTSDLETFKQFYFGGRTECFRIGKFKTTDRSIHCIDINSLYPSVLEKNCYPNPYRYKIERSPETFSEFSLVFCRVKSSMEIPVLAKRIDHKLCFPNGEFDVHTNSKELQYFLDQGGELIKIHKSINFPFYFKPFSDYVNTLYNERIKTNDEFYKNVLKLLLNSLYGKFAQNRYNSVILSLDEYMKGLEENKVYQDVRPILNPFHDKTKTDYILATEKQEKFPFQTNFIWSIFCTGYARIELHKLLKQTARLGNELFYCDTDSVIYEGEKMEGGNILGGFKNEWSTNQMEIQNLKQYSYKGENRKLIFKCKGVPEGLRSDYFKGKQIQIHKPVKLRESLRAKMEKNKQANIWVDFPKQKKSHYSKGFVTYQGYVLPFELK